MPQAERQFHECRTVGHRKRSCPAPGGRERHRLLYHCYDPRLTQFRDRKKEFATARLLFYWDANSSSLMWILLATPGQWFNHEAGHETWLDPASVRVQMFGYELIRHIRSGSSRPSWTWRFTKSREQEIRLSLIHAIRAHRDDQLRNLIATIWRAPGFAGIREQVKKFRQVILGDWRRSRIAAPP